jgi:hypothetical protein
MKDGLAQPLVCQKRFTSSGEGEGVCEARTVLQDVLPDDEVPRQITVAVEHTVVRQQRDQQRPRSKRQIDDGGPWGCSGTAGSGIF